MTIFVGPNDVIPKSRYISVSQQVPDVSDGSWGGYVLDVVLSADLPGAGASVTAETDWGQSTDPGILDTYSRSDHTHGTPTEPVGTSMLLMGG